MPADILCRVVLANGERCGFVPEGETAKEKITNLFRHEQAHLPKVVIINPNFAVRIQPEDSQ